MRKKLTVAAISVAVALAAFAVYEFALDHSTPAGQAALVEVNEEVFEQIKADFNEARGQVRVISLLSPT